MRPTVIIQVEWTEVNAAWGQALLLLHTIARKLNYTFETYTLHPLGSFSKIERIADKAVYELYGTGDMALGRLLHNRRFDTAMISFLDCLRQVMEFVKKEDPSVVFSTNCTYVR
jgi:beclin 1